MGNTKWVHLMFALGGLLFAFVLVQTVDWVWSFFGKPKELYCMLIGTPVAGVATFLIWRSEKYFTKATEIANELTKVSWPTRKETSQATVVVIATVIIAALFLGVFDLIWSWATDLILLPPKTPKGG